MVDRITVEDDVCPSTTEAAHRLGVGVRTLCRFIDEGAARLPVRPTDSRPGGRPRGVHRARRITPGRWRRENMHPHCRAATRPMLVEWVAALLAVVGYRLSGAPNSSAR